MRDWDGDEATSSTSTRLLGTSGRGSGSSGSWPLVPSCPLAGGSWPPVVEPGTAGTAESSTVSGSTALFVGGGGCLGRGIGVQRDLVVVIITTRGTISIVSGSRGAIGVIGSRCSVVVVVITSRCTVRVIGGRTIGISSYFSGSLIVFVVIICCRSIVIISCGGTICVISTSWGTISIIGGCRCTISIIGGCAISISSRTGSRCLIVIISIVVICWYIFSGCTICVSGRSIITSRSWGVLPSSAAEVTSCTASGCWAAGRLVEAASSGAAGTVSVAAAVGSYHGQQTYKNEDGTHG